MSMEESELGGRGISTAELVIRRSFLHARVTYSPGEPVPNMPSEDLERHILSGAIAKIGEKLTQVVQSRLETADDYLRGPDVQVIRNLDRGRPGMETAQQMLVLAKRQRRSSLLIATLQLMNGVPVE